MLIFPNRHGLDDLYTDKPWTNAQLTRFETYFNNRLSEGGIRVSELLNANSEHLHDRLKGVQIIKDQPECGGGACGVGSVHDSAA